jgi:hypothetical protein
MLVQLNDEEDIFSWNLTTLGSFTIRLFYHDLLNGHTIFLKKYLWKIKVPLKIKIFVWFVHIKEILTKDNLAKRNWQGNTKCCFCDQEETIQHLFIDCPFAKKKNLWRIVHMTFTILTPPKIITCLLIG